MKFDNPKQFVEFEREMTNASMAIRQQQATRIGVNQCYYEGIHYVSANVRGPDGYRLGRLRTDYRAESSELRVQTNDYSRMIQKVKAGTYPKHIFIEASPPEFDLGIEAECAAESHETLVNTLIKMSGFTAAAQTANFERTVAGAWGIGLTLRYTHDDHNDKQLVAFDFHPSHLILDPNVKDRQLPMHEYVCYEDVWTLKKIGNTFPDLRDKLQNPTDFKTVGDLDPVKMNMNAISGGRLYAQYASHSKTRGAKVRQWHFKGPGNRFDRMLVFIEIPGGLKPEEQVVNFEDSETPFGGCGMPFDMIYGHRRSEAPGGVGLSDGDMFRVSQDMINLGESLWWRIQQTYGAPITVVDRRAFKAGSTDEEIKAHFPNRVGGIIIGDFSGRGREGNPVMPRTEVPPAPQPAVRDGIDRHTEAMRESSHKSSASFGDVKTHIPKDTFQRSEDDSGDVMDERISADIEAYTQVLRVVHGTGIKHVQEEVPTILGALRRAGMEPQGFSDIFQQDATNPATTIMVLDESVRTRSHRQKKLDLDNAAAAELIDPMTYRMTMAKDQETPILPQDKQMASDAKAAVRRVLLGEEWNVVDLGEYSEFFISRFRTAIFDKVARNDPETRARLSRAIDAQRQKSMEAELASNPELVLQQLQAANSDPSVEQQNEVPQPSTVGELLDGIIEQPAQ